MSVEYPEPPAKLRDREIWLAWHYEERTDSNGEPYQTKVPDNPHDTPRSGTGDSTDPDKRTTFEEITAYAADYADDIDGIGFAFPEDDLLCGVDLDDVVNQETGEVREWATDVIDALDSYTEYSPSGSGYHVIVFGIKPGDRCKRKRDDGETEIECYDDSRFFTYTGDHVESTAETVNQRNDALSKVYYEYLEEQNDGDLDEYTDDDDDGEIETPDIDLDDEDLLEKARNAENGAKFCYLEDGGDSMHGGDTSAADQAFVNLLAFWTGRDRQQMDRLFRDSDRMRSKWDEDRGEQTYGELTIDTALSKVTDWYEPGGGGSSPPTVSENGETTGPGGTSTGDAQASSSEDDSLPLPKWYSATGQTIRDGCYGYHKAPRNDDDNPEWVEVTNFQLEANSFMIGTDHDSIELVVHPAGVRDSYTVTVPTTVFNELRSFKKRVLTRRGATYSAGGDMLAEVKKFVEAQDAPVRTGTDHIGLHRNGDKTEWVTPNGVLSADGWRENPDTVLTLLDSPIKEKWGLSPEDGDEYDSEAVKDILRLVPQTRPHERFLPALGWFYAAPLRPLITDDFREDEFNILNVLGNSGSGKSSSLEVLWQLLGMDAEPFRADGTPFPLMKAMASSNALPLVFDEYKPADMSDYRKNNLHSYLRTSTRGGIEEKGNPDMTIDGYHLRAPVCLAGEQPLKGTAEERRSIQTAFTRGPTKNGRPERDAFTRLTGGKHGDQTYDGYDLFEHARAYFPWLLSQDESDLQQAWRDAHTTVSGILDELEVSGLDKIVVQGYQTVAFGMTLYRKFATDMGAEIDGLPVFESDVAESIEYLTDEGTGAEHVSNVDRLLGLAGRAAAADYLEHDEHYTLVHEGNPDEELVVHLQTAFDAVRKYARDYDVTGEDLLDSHADYHSRFRDEQEREDSYIIASSKPAKPIGRGVAFHFERACSQVDGLSRGLFVESEQQVETDDSDGIKDLATLSPGDGYVSVEGMAASVLDPKPWLDGEGTLKDESGHIDYIVRGAIDAEIEQAGTYRFTDARVTTEEGVTTLELRGGMTSIEPTGHTARTQDALAETVEATDGGQDITEDEEENGDNDGDDDLVPTTVQTVTKVVNNEGGIRFAELRAQLSLNYDIHPETVEQGIERAISQGRVIQGDAGEIKPA